MDVYIYICSEVCSNNIYIYILHINEYNWIYIVTYMSLLVYDMKVSVKWGIPHSSMVYFMINPKIK